ncbi:hypothetical protein H2201_004849 [Coniosporium apollinis]|uniref:Prion-inhibition and propagation HeLo domain-containing protein n=2 Tax=Coniosporium TaxID=2810619 RepID=A0ABQ9NRF4_9PEZI|nr:hypothetical protein H2199_004568 [Cladosporium sp. JES 115]KAJ9664985.1 hypothetical protein H2201_004849 [Coniosporium apollinis]
MAEVAGLIIGSVALTGLFNNCVDTFQYIQLGRNFGNDYETSLLRLDVVKLRFTRWGALMTMQDGTESPRPRAAASPEQVELAARLLGQIMNTFERTKEASKTFQMIAKPEQLAIGSRLQSGNLAMLHESLQRKIQERCKARQMGTSLTAKAKWAIYKKAHFNRLIEELTDLVDSLLFVFPDSEGFQRQLCTAEVSDIGKDESLMALRDAASGSDETLEEVVQETLDTRGVQYWRNVKAAGRAEQFMGNDYSGVEEIVTKPKRQDWEGILGMDEARQFMGNVYGGGSFFG